MLQVSLPVLQFFVFPPSVDVETQLLTSTVKGFKVQNENMVNLVSRDYGRGVTFVLFYISTQHRYSPSCLLADESVS